MSNKVNKPALYFSPASILSFTLNERYVYITFRKVMSLWHMAPFCQYVCKKISCPPHLKTKLKQISFYLFFVCLKSAKLSGSIFKIPCQHSGGLAMYLKLSCFDAGSDEDVHPTGTDLFVKACQMRCKYNTFTFV